MQKTKIWFGSLLAFFLIFSSLFLSTFAYANNPPDKDHSSFSATSTGSNQAPADGVAIAHMTLTLKDSSDSLLTEDSVSVAIPSNSSVKISPTSATLDVSGKANFEFTSAVAGTFSIDVTDNGTTLTGLGQVIFNPIVTPAPDTGICTNPAPGGAPQLTKATATATHQITLTWTKAPDPVTYYLLSYGTASGKYIYGDPNIGGHNTISYTVGGLVTGTTYYFVIRAGNGCTPGTFSNEISAKMSTSSPAPKPIPTEDNTPVVEETPEETIVNTPVETSTPEPSESPTPLPSTGPVLTTDNIVKIITVIGIVAGFIYLVLSWREKRKKPEGIPPLNSPQQQNPFPKTDTL